MQKIHFVLVADIASCFNVVTMHARKHTYTCTCMHTHTHTHIHTHRHTHTQLHKADLIEIYCHKNLIVRSKIMKTPPYRTLYLHLTQDNFHHDHFNQHLDTKDVLVKMELI